MANQLKNAIVRSTGEKVQVYKHHNGGWIDYKDCNTEYCKAELTFIE